MIKDAALWRTWEDELTRRTPVDFTQNMMRMEALYEHAVLLGAWGARAPLDGIGPKLKLAGILNVQRTPGETGAGI